MKAFVLIPFLLITSTWALNLDGLVVKNSILLKSYFFESNLIGLDASQANSLCEKYKEKYKKDYLQVYCIFHVKSKIYYSVSDVTTSWDDQITTRETEYDYEYEYVSDLSTYEYEYEGRRSNHNEVTHQSKGTSQVTIVRPIKYSLYGVNIYGYGDPNSNESYLIFDKTSEQYYFGYDDYREAKRSCQDFIYQQDDHDGFYFKAFCEVVHSSQDQRYRYAVYSKLNPQDF